MAYAATKQVQIVQNVEQENVNRFWKWYQDLNEGDRMAAIVFLQHFLLEKRTSGEFLTIFSNNRGQALILSSFIEQAKSSQMMKDILTCVAKEGGSGCAPTLPKK
ncbi:MAG: hypothetical protein HC820_00360 [Hydrococcus sp. RM1_1_31]|nr:hypothetical protein [Hydrococcus sp. RM1_1_31]